MKGMDLGKHADIMSGRNSRGKQAVWTSAMSSFVLKFMANLVADGTRTSNGFREVHHISCAKALNEHFKLHLTAIQVSNHLRKWKKKWAKVNKLKNLSGAVWDEHTCTIVLDLEHYTGHVQDHHSDADFLNTPIALYHEMATICGNGMASGAYARSSNKPLATYVTGNGSGNEENNGDSDSLDTDETENETENEKANGASGPLDTDVFENEKTSEETAKCLTITCGGSFGDPPGSLPPPKKAKGLHLEHHVDNMEGNNDGGGVVVWTNATSSFVLQFLAKLVAGGIRPWHVFKQVHLKSCARALSEHFRVEVNAAQISNHLRKWKKIWAKVSMLKSLSGALWDDNTCTIVLDLEHYAAHVKDHHNDADFLNTPIKHYREMATIFVKDMTSSRPAKSSSGPLARDLTGTLIENENMDGANDLIAKCVEEAAVSFSDSDEGNVGDSPGSLPPPPKKAKVKNDESRLCTMTRTLDRLTKAIEKCSRIDADVPEDLWANMKDLPGFEQEHLAHYYAYLCENPVVARAFYKLSWSPKMVWVSRYIKIHLSA
uniref:Uncharacterized protein n=1 Tax=Avena sativa TaxID=4498 RepID=A0ACD5UDF2_AVESA